MDMFENIPDDVPEQYLSGAAAFVRSDGERHDGTSQADYAWALNEIVGLARVSVDDDDARATQEVVTANEAGDDALAPDEYSSNVFGSEVREWAEWAMDHAETEA